MKRKIGRALRRELDGVRVSPGLKRRILAEAAMPAFRRPSGLRRPTLAAAAVLVAVVGGLALMLSLRAPSPDVQRSAVAAQGGGEGTFTPSPMPTQEATVTVTLDRDGAVASMASFPEENADAGLETLDEANLYLNAAAFEGGVLAVESSYLYDFIVHDAPPFDENEAIGETPAATLDAALATLDGALTDGERDTVRATCEGNPGCGVEWSRVRLDAEGVDARPDGGVYRFVDAAAPGNALVLYLLDEDWAADKAGIAVQATRLLWQYDGETVRTQQTALNAPCEALAEGAFRLAADGEAEAPPVVALPVEDGGGVRRSEGGMAELTDDGEFAVNTTLLTFDGGETVLIVEPMEGDAFTARIHAIQTPTLVLDAQAHPGMAGWVFDAPPDDGDVIDIVDAAGTRHLLTFGDLAYDLMAFGDVPRDDEATDADPVAEAAALVREAADIEDAEARAVCEYLDAELDRLERDAAAALVRDTLLDIGASGERIDESEWVDRLMELLYQ